MPGLDRQFYHLLLGADARSLARLEKAAEKVAAVAMEQWDVRVAVSEIHTERLIGPLRPLHDHDGVATRVTDAF